MEADSKDGAKRPAPPHAWKPGQSGNPKGRSPRPVEERYRKITISKTTPEVWGRIVEKACVQAEGGDKDARAWLSKQLGLDAPQKIEQKITGGAQKPLTIEYVNDWRPHLHMDDSPSPTPSE